MIWLAYPDQPPSPGQQCLAYRPVSVRIALAAPLVSCDMYVAEYTHGERFVTRDLREIAGVTHWMPLPAKPPKTQEHTDAPIQK